MRLRPGKISAIILVPVAVLLLAAGLYWKAFFATALTPEAEQLVVVAPGSSFTSTARQLERAGVISSARNFVLLARWKRVAGKVHAGEYLFAEAATPGRVLARLVSGDVRKLQVTIPEGFNLKEIAARIEQAGVAPAEQVLALATDPALLRQEGVAAASLEGYLFPETYSVDSGTSAATLLRLMLAELKRQLGDELLQKAKGHGLDRHQLLTLASIVQKEAGSEAEMPLIAAVFQNRLRKGIPLQADPTVIYDAADYHGNLTRKHLETSTPYNTYRRRGLPPGPIASPGLAALRAAADPPEVNYLYFVARGDGSHEFSATLKEHNRAVRRYQLRR